jgi:hypothetical protein
MQDKLRADRYKKFLVKIKQQSYLKFFFIADAMVLIKKLSGWLTRRLQRLQEQHCLFISPVDN